MGMDEFDEEEEMLDMTFGDDWYDVTDEVTCYEKGKTFECECGQWIGCVHGEKIVDCASCDNVCVDRKADERGPPNRKDGQFSLNNWT